MSNIKFLANLYLEKIASTDFYRRYTADRTVHEFTLNKSALRTQIYNAIGLQEASSSVTKICYTFFNDIQRALRPRTSTNGYIVEALPGNSNDTISVKIIGPTANSNVYGWIFDTLAPAKNKAYSSLANNKVVKSGGQLKNKKDFLDLSHEGGSQIGENAYKAILEQVEQDFLARPGVRRDELKKFELAIATGLKELGKSNKPVVSKITYKDYKTNRGTESKRDKDFNTKLYNLIRDTADNFIEEPVYESVEKHILTEATKKLRQNPDIHLKGFRVYDLKDAKQVVKKSSKDKISKQDLRKAKNQVRFGAQQNKIGVVAFLTYLNKGLPGQVASNMGSPALNYRTGRFAQSVYALDVRETKNRGLSIHYTYQRSPYELFEYPGGSPRLATPQRDPRKIIDKSIRELATDIVKTRFYTKRL
jgi:hypothetical protein